MVADYTKAMEANVVIIFRIVVPAHQVGPHAAVMDEEAMMFDVAEEARKEMLITGLRKATNPKDRDLGFWRRGKIISRAATIIR